MYKAAQKEISSLLRQNILDQHQIKSGKGKIFVLNSILQEHTLRYIMLREFYEDLEQNRNVKYETEVKTQFGPVDLVFYEDQNKFAFEIKRWQTESETKGILEKDIKKLKNFRNSNKNSYCYELIFTDNDYEKSKETYEKEFNEDFRETQLKLLGCKTIDNVDFTSQYLF